jgi:hypothetical protein
VELCLLCPTCVVLSVSTGTTLLYTFSSEFEFFFFFTVISPTTNYTNLPNATGHFTEKMYPNPYLNFG